MFGSVATDDAEGDSDVDFLVTMARAATLVDLIGLRQELESLLEGPVNVISDDAVHPDEGGGRLHRSAAVMRLTRGNRIPRAARRFPGSPGMVPAVPSAEGTPA